MLYTSLKIKMYTVYLFPYTVQWKRNENKKKIVKSYSKAVFEMRMNENVERRKLHIKEFKACIVQLTTYGRS